MPGRFDKDPPEPAVRGERALVTGCAGFLGSHLCEALVASGCDVRGVDCFTDYYDRAVKQRNLERLRDEARFELLEIDLSEDDLTGVLEGVGTVFHLAAQPGVRGSFGEGFAVYLRHNVRASQRLLEEAARHPVRSFTYASSSSIYGDATDYPTTEATPPRPVSPYGLTKLAAEQLAGVYHRCFGVPVVGLRYFSAYGPRQRPDMAISRFLRRAITGKPLPLFGDGRQVRDFTYVDDVVAGTIAAARRGRPGRIYDVGGGHPVELIEAVHLIGELTGRKLQIEWHPAQMGEARRTGCSGAAARKELGFSASTALADGLAAQLAWELDDLRRHAQVA